MVWYIDSHQKFGKNWLTGTGHSLKTDSGHHRSPGATSGRNDLCVVDETLFAHIYIYICIYIYIYTSNDHLCTYQACSPTYQANMSDSACGLCSVRGHRFDSTAHMP